MRRTAPALRGTTPDAISAVAFSQRPPHTGVDRAYVAGLWHRLMQGLGYQRYGAHGGDFAGVANPTWRCPSDDRAPLIPATARGAARLAVVHARRRSHSMALLQDG